MCASVRGGRAVILIVGTQETSNKSSVFYLCEQAAAQPRSHSISIQQHSSSNTTDGGVVQAVAFVPVITAVYVCGWCAAA